MAEMPVCVFEVLDEDALQGRIWEELGFSYPIMRRIAQDVWDRCHNQTGKPYQFDIEKVREEYRELRIWQEYHRFGLDGNRLRELYEEHEAPAVAEEIERNTDFIVIGDFHDDNGWCLLRKVR